MISESGMEVCEIGCGPGIFALQMGELFPRSTIYGLDISEEALTTGRQKANQKGIENVNFSFQDICEMPADWTDKWPFLCGIDIIHDVPFSTKAIAEIHRVLKPGGQALILDINARSRMIDNKDECGMGGLYSISLFHCMPVSLSVPGGEGLGCVWGREKAVSMFSQAGYSDVKVVDDSGFLSYLLTK